MSNDNRTRMESVRHELLSDVAAQTSMILKELGLNDDAADQAGCAIADHLAQHWGGQHVTIPMDYHYNLSIRDMEIWEKFNGRNQADLAREYGVSVNAIYRILKRTGRKAASRYQTDLFASK